MEKSNRHRELALDALRRLRGDDLERAHAAFRYMTPEELNEEHGQSGMKRGHILTLYAEHVKKVEEAIRWVESV